jgi:FlaA1/EpsC-like NDP-sugar epimerase
MCVRFGNVIGSRGSVIPVMQEQIRRGGPVTVTHPEMTRYFMSTREAVALVLQASAVENEHEVIVLDMGEPVRILELAQELIRLSGLEPDRDIPIVFTGIRPGEKLHETLETTDEPLETTAVPKVLAVSANGRPDEVTLRLALQELDRLSRATDMTGIRSILRRLTTDSGKIPLWTLGS